MHVQKNPHSIDPLPNSKSMAAPVWTAALASAAADGEEVGGEELLKEVVQALLGQGKAGALSDDSLLALHAVFQQNLVPALDLVERGAVTKYVCSSGRQLYLVVGSTGNQYVCFGSSSYCSCPSFVYSVLARGSALLCKHQLAVQLARATHQCKQVEVSGEEWASLVAMDTKME